MTRKLNTSIYQFKIKESVFNEILRSNLNLETTYDFSKSPLAKDAKAKTILSIKAMFGNNHKSMMNFRLYLDVSPLTEYLKANEVESEEQKA